MENLHDIAAKTWDVVVIGGGATGTGILRDLAMRGFQALLLEQQDLAHGTSSRFHGLLHSGARYAVVDEKAAQECISENQILRRIGKYCVEETEGLFVLLPEDRAADPSYELRWVQACSKCGIKVKQISVDEALHLEPNLSPKIVAAYCVPDAAIDGFRLVWQNVFSAKRYGADFRTYTAITGIHIEDKRVTGVDIVDTLTGEKAKISCNFLINAAGSWAGNIVKLAHLHHIDIRPDRGTLIAFNHRFTNRIINRLHKSGDGDIFVPHGSITVFGTTSQSTHKPDDFEPRQEEVLYLLEIGRKFIPHIDTYRILRAFSGTRPLYAPHAIEGAGRGVSRNFVILDHAEDGLDGMVTICGGKFTTYRMMAERTVNLICEKCGRNSPCHTAEEALVPEIDSDLYQRAASCFPAQGLDLAIARLGELLEPTVTLMEQDPLKKVLLCECEMVTLAEFEIIANQPTSHTLNDIRRRTRIGMGTCQGTWCALRALAAKKKSDPESLLYEFQQERWHGIYPVLWGQALREMIFARQVCTFS